jgi:DNA-binding IscR family transcriptional regulator
MDQILKKINQVKYMINKKLQYYKHTLSLSAYIKKNKSNSAKKIARDFRVPVEVVERVINQLNLKGKI